MLKKNYSPCIAIQNSYGTDVSTLDFFEFLFILLLCLLLEDFIFLTKNKTAKEFMDAGRSFLTGH